MVTLAPALLALALLVLLLRRGNRLGLLVQYLYFCRFPVLLAAALAGLAALALRGGLPTVSNLFWLSPREILLVAWLATLAAWVVMIAVENILRYGPARFRVEPLRLPRRIARLRVPLFALLGLPVIAAALARSAPRLAQPPFRPWQGWVAAVGGIALAALCLLASAAVHALLRDPDAPALAAPGDDLLIPGAGPLLARLPSLRRRRGDGGSGGHRARRGKRDREAGRTVEPGRRGRLLDLLCRHLPGYFDPERRRMWPGHAVALIFLAINLGIYLLGYLLLRPSAPALPAVGAALFALILLGWALPGLAFFLDRFRVPVLLLLVALATVSSRVSDTDHYYRFYPRAEGVGRDPSKSRQVYAGRYFPPRVDPMPPPNLPHGGGTPALLLPENGERRPAVPSLTPGEAFAAAERARPGSGRPVVVVAASGGGITASLWTAVVLAGLQREAGPELAPAIRFVSTVSGGSVGAMYFLDRFPGAGPPSPAIVRAAGEPSLDSVAWGLAYPDLWRFFFSYLLPEKTLDRGWAMELAWRRHMAHGRAAEATLAGWREAVARGELPAFAFNATVAETGEQFLFTPLDLPDCGRAEFRRPECWRARSFLRDYSRPDRPADLPVATAARMSASFPWVSPIARALDGEGHPATPRLHLADGGYYDNFGVVTAVNWLQSLLPGHREELARRRVILVLIRAFPEKDAPDPRGGGAGGWFYTTVGPLSTIYNVRTATQAVRNDTDIGLLRQALAGVGVRLDTVLFELQEKSPLSWKLTGEERARIEQGWRSDANRAQLTLFKTLFAAPPATEAPPRPSGHPPQLPS